MRIWIADRLIGAMDRLSYWLLAGREPKSISDYDRPTRQVASE